MRKSPEAKIESLSKDLLWFLKPQHILVSSIELGLSFGERIEYWSKD
jgi:hypothetical protein